MTPAQAKAMYARQIGANGETLSLIRLAPAGATTVSVRGRIMMMFPGQASDRFVSAITDTVSQRRPTAIILHDDLVTGGFPVPPVKGDVVARGSKKFKVTEADDMTRRLAGETVAYQLVLAG